MATKPKTTKKTIQERIAAAEARKIKADEAIAKLKALAANLSKEKPGINAAIAAVENAAKLNSVKSADVIKAIAKIMRTGLKIEKATRKAKDPNAPKPFGKPTIVKDKKKSAVSASKART